MQTTPLIKYRLVGITAGQFATIQEPTSNSVDIRLGVSIGTNFDKRALGISTAFQFVNSDCVFMQIENTCHYEIEEEWWEANLNSSGEITLPSGFIKNLIALTINTTRGVLFAKTENTPYNKYFLPLLDANTIEADDFVMKKER